MDVREALAARPALAIIRADRGDHLVAVARAMAEAGVPAVEVTLTTPGALDAVTLLARDAEGNWAVGVGSVRTTDDVRRAADAGAGFLVCPHTSLPVLAEATRRGLPVLAGAWTPTEVETAWTGGAALVKLFPASSGGIAHLRALRAPLPDVPLVPTGGLGIDDATDWLDAGAAAVALGGSLVGDACEGGSLAALAARARRLVAAVQR